MGKAVQGLTGLLAHSRPKRGQRMSARRAKGPAGFLVLAGAAGLSLKNRDADAAQTTAQGGDRPRPRPPRPRPKGSPSPPPAP